MLFYIPAKLTTNDNNRVHITTTKSKELTADLNDDLTKLAGDYNDDITKQSADYNDIIS